MIQVEGQKRLWTLTTRIDGGGFGAVWTASSDGSVAAVKLVPKTPGADRELLFGEDLTDVRNVVPVIDSGELPDSWALVMPMADESLEDYVQREAAPLRVEIALPILTDIAMALVDIGARGVVHRDLKPANVLLLGGRWCLSDFGISRYAEATTANDTRKYAMTAPYAAPEQWRHQRATSATDVYAFGIIAYRMLTGALPFNGPEYREQHLQSKPARIANISSSIAALVEQCLLKDPGSRPTVLELLNRLESLAGSTQVGAGLAALHQANRVAVEELQDLSSRESQRQSAEERRGVLRSDASNQLDNIGSTLRDAISTAAPVAVITNVGPYRTGPALRIGLNHGEIRLDKMTDTGNRTHLDVITTASISVAQDPDYRTYVGRSHSLWFCDAHEEDVYRWYEVAFMDHPLMSQQSRPVDPFAAQPDSDIAVQALGPGMGTYQLAWPFTLVRPGETDDFVNRWATWLATASSGTLSRPQALPEGQILGSWRPSHR